MSRVSGGIRILLLLLPDGCHLHCRVCHYLTFTTVGLRVLGEHLAQYFALLMGIGNLGPAMGVHHSGRSSANT